MGESIIGFRSHVHVELLLKYVLYSFRMGLRSNLVLSVNLVSSIRFKLTAGQKINYNMLLAGAKNGLLIVILRRDGRLGEVAFLKLLITPDEALFPAVTKISSVLWVLNKH